MNLFIYFMSCFFASLAFYYTTIHLVLCCMQCMCLYTLFFVNIQTTEYIVIYLTLSIFEVADTSMFYQASLKH